MSRSNTYNMPDYIEQMERSKKKLDSEIARKQKLRDGDRVLPENFDVLSDKAAQVHKNKVHNKNLAKWIDG